MLTTASMVPLAPLYFEIVGLKTSSNSRFSALNLSRMSSSKQPSGSRITLVEKGWQQVGAVVAVEVGADVVSMLSTGITCLT